MASKHSKSGKSIKLNKKLTRIKARKEQNITQAELAKRVGTQKSNISRLESGNYNPSLDFLIRVSEALGKSLSVQLM